jgi:hypothetical protein
MTPLPITDYKGYACELAGGYNCPALRLYGYATELALHRAITRKLREHAAIRCGSCYGSIARMARWPRCQTPALHGRAS